MLCAGLLHQLLPEPAGGPTQHPHLSTAHSTHTAHTQHTHSTHTAHTQHTHSHFKPSASALSTHPANSTPRHAETLFMPAPTLAKAKQVTITSTQWILCSALVAGIEKCRRSALPKTLYRYLLLRCFAMRTPPPVRHPCPRTARSHSNLLDAATLSPSLFPCSLPLMPPRAKPLTVAAAAAAFQILWTFSIYLESVAIMPQLFLLQKTEHTDVLTWHYVFCMGIYSRSARLSFC